MEDQKEERPSAWSAFAKGAARGVCGGFCSKKGKSEVEREDEMRLTSSGPFEEGSYAEKEIPPQKEISERSGEKIGRVSAKAGKGAAKFGARFTKKLLQSEEGRKVVKNVAVDAVKGVSAARKDRSDAEEMGEDKPKRTMTGHVASSVVGGMMKSEDGRAALRGATRESVNEMVRERRGDDPARGGDTMYGKVADGVLGGLMESKEGRRAIEDVAGGLGDAAQEKSRDRGSGTRFSSVLGAVGVGGRSGKPAFDDEFESGTTSKFASKRAQYDARFEGFE